MATARLLKSGGRVHLFRAGLWKPRTRPTSFMGVGEMGLPWLQRVTRELGLPVCTEVALPEHVEKCLKYGIRVMWIGARTVSNPFSVQEIVDAVRGSDCCILVKNPLNPDIDLWAGALERFQKAGIDRLGAIHRGFYPFEKTQLRNIPKWEIAIEMKIRFPEVPVICDASHIAGKRSLLPDIIQKALDLNMDGLMIESHYAPGRALSDSGQQLTPGAFHQLLERLDFRESVVEASAYSERLETLRDQVDSIDEQVVELLSQRMKVIEKIGAYKKKHNLAIVQVKRWSEILGSRIPQGKKNGLSRTFLNKMMQAIHEESIRKQTLIFRDKGKV